MRQQVALIVMMALGSPGGIVTAIMLGALLVHDVIPSPSFISDEPTIAYSIFLTRPWALFFILLSGFSILFSTCQKNLGKKRWTA